MKKLNAKFLSLVVAVSAMFGGIAQAQVDSTGSTALTGAVTLDSSLIPNQGSAYVRPWTFSFVGQTIANSRESATILSDGSVDYRLYGSRVTLAPVTLYTANEPIAVYYRSNAGTRDCVDGRSCTQTTTYASPVGDPRTGVTAWEIKTCTVTTGWTSGTACTSVR